MIIMICNLYCSNIVMTMYCSINFFVAKKIQSVSNK